MKYQDFALTFQHLEGPRYRVVADCSRGQFAGTFEIPDAFLEPVPVGARGGDPKPLRRIRLLAPLPETDRKVLGKQLFLALFQGPVGQALSQETGYLESGQTFRPLRIQLWFDLHNPPEARLNELPWEILFDPVPNNKFVVLGERVSLVRYLMVSQPPERRPVTPPLRILLVMATDVGSPLGLDEEKRAIEEAWKVGGSAKLRVLTRFTLDEFEQELRRGPHVIHFMGHADFDEATGEGAVLFPAPGGGAVRFEADSAGLLLAGVPSLRLVVLNACETAKSDPQKPFAGLAASLARAGVPAVVAMGEPIQDRAAIVFSRRLYQELAARQPLDRALSRARMTMAVEPSLKGTFAWALPQLFLRNSRPLVETQGRRLVKLVLVASAISAVLALGVLWKLWRHYDDVVSGATLFSHATVVDGRVVELCNPQAGWWLSAEEVVQGLGRGNTYFTRSPDKTTGRIEAVLLGGELVLRTQADGLEGNNLSSLEPCPTRTEARHRGAPSRGTGGEKLHVDPPQAPNEEKR